mmetsp:Transcript_12177/g.42118  ORF Transcript_12177/g.42118 Transcript_12177/m.42118 type:complete len:569 (+) Transcript_12177:716-2422(+)
MDDVFTTKAALSLHRDMFTHAAHVVVRCRVWAPGAASPQSCTAFVDVGSAMLPGDDGDDVCAPPELSLRALRALVDPTADADAVAETSAVTRLLPRKNSVWVGCVSAKMLDVQETRQTLALLEAVPTADYAASRRQTMVDDIALLGPVDDATVAKLQKLSNAESAPWADRVSRTQKLAAERRRWYATAASQTDSDADIYLANVSDDAMCSGRLRYAVTAGRNVVFGCDSRPHGAAETFVHVGLACVQAAHVKVSLLRDGIVAVDVLGTDAFSTARKNNELITSTAELRTGDTLLVGQALLLRVVSGGETGEHASDDADAWAGAMRAFHRESIVAAVWSSQPKPPQAWARRYVEDGCASVFALVHEANGSADEVHKDVHFSLQACRDADPFDREAFLSIIVESALDDVPAAWRPRTLASRLYEMRRCRLRFHELGGDHEKLILDLPRGHDGFFDAPTAHQLIGVAVVYLDALTYLIDIDEAFDVISFQGEVVGAVKLNVHATIREDDQESDADDDDVPCVSLLGSAFNGDVGTRPRRRTSQTTVAKRLLSSSTSTRHLACRAGSARRST